MGAMASQITSLPIVYSTVPSGADKRKHQSSASLAFVRWIHRWAVNSPHKWPVTQKMFPFDDVIIRLKKPKKSHQHQSENVILTTFSSLAALELLTMTTSSAISDENFIKMKTFPFQWMSPWHRIRFIFRWRHYDVMCLVGRMLGLHYISTLFCCIARLRKRSKFTSFRITPVFNPSLFMMGFGIRNRAIA